MPGHLAVILHAHLPFVRHPEQPRFLEEEWLYEAISESYLPLLLAFDRLANDSIPFRLTLSLSPTLLAMLGDEMLVSRYEKRLDELCQLGDKEVYRTRTVDRVFHPVARFYRERLVQLRQAFVHTYRRDIVGGFQSLQRAGHIDIITTAATHAYLPLFQSIPEAVSAQVKVAVNEYQRLFNERSLGFWLPECGYYPGLENVLAESELRFFFVDAHAVELADPQPIHGVYAPIFTEAGVAAFARDPLSSEQVWSATRGFPGDFAYREYYRDIGWYLEEDCLRPFLPDDGSRRNTGFKYFRITGPSGDKAPYEPEFARQKAWEHARIFLSSRQQEAQQLEPTLGQTPIMVAPYDAELFGHWWFEGPLFLEALIRMCSAEGNSHCSLITPADYLRRYPEHQVTTPSFSSWGAGGYSEMWLNEETDWLYQPLHQGASAMVDLAKKYDRASGTLERALNQCARELLLAQSSDWPFIMKSGTVVSYAKRRAVEHLSAFTELEAAIRSGSIDLDRLHSLQEKNNIFPELNFRVFRGPPD